MVNVAPAMKMTHLSIERPTKSPNWTPPPMMEMSVHRTFKESVYSSGEMGNEDDNTE
jgi:hypothetical protein